MKFPGNILLIIFAFTSFIQCDNMPEVTYTYVDGSNNLYLISPDTLEYKPVQPEHSSSGVYSGGDPAITAITSEQFEAMATVFETAKNQPELHIEKRLMGSGTVTGYEVGQKKWSFFLPMGSEVKEEIESKLKNALNIDD